MVNSSYKIYFAFFICFFQLTGYGNNIWANDYDTTTTTQDFLIAPKGNPHPEITIDMNEIFQQLPQTIMHNIGDRLKFYVDKVQWKYEKAYLLIRIPTSKHRNSYIYAIKDYNNPKEIFLFSVQFYPKSNSRENCFSGRQIWINYQDWHIYGVYYDKGKVVDYLHPIKIINKDWEKCAMNNHRFYLDKHNQIAVKPESKDTTAQVNCAGNDGLYPNLGSFFKQFSKVVKHTRQGLYGFGRHQKDRSYSTDANESIAPFGARPWEKMK